jgi:hypothetical protein
LRRKYDVIPLFISVAQAAAKEKVVRVNIATLRVSNFASLSDVSSPLRTHLFEDDSEPRHEGTIRQSASDVGRSAPSVREEPRDA